MPVKTTGAIATPPPRLARCFANLKRESRAGLVTFITAGDPDYETSAAILKGLPAAGADIIELGMPFSDPMADGPAIQAASLRALKNGMTLQKTLSAVKEFRAGDANTPIILMGYYNPIYRYGGEKFIADARAAGVDGLIIVDLPIEESDEFATPARQSGLHWIPLVTPTTDAARLQKILSRGSGFVYHIAIAGVTGTRSSDTDIVQQAVKNIRAQTELPVAVGFGIKTTAHVQQIATHADAVVVGSAIIDRIAAAHADKTPRAELVTRVHDFVRELASGLRR